MTKKHKENEEIKKENAEIDKEKTAEEQFNESEKLISELNIYKDTLLRKVAEFENYKKRTETEISNYIKYASEHLIKELLPVYDDLSRSIESVNKGETKDIESLKQGIASVYDKFRGILEREGLKEINVKGKEFNVDLCDALLQVPSSDFKPHTVIDVVEKGYFLKDKVIRHAKVLVSSEPEEKEMNS